MGRGSSRRDAAPAQDAEGGTGQDRCRDH
jgi:hypothetical protein